MKDSYTNGDFRIDHDIVNSQDNFYSITWKAESDPSVLEHAKLCGHPVTIEYNRSTDSVIQQIIESNFPRKHNFAPELTAEAYSDTHSSQVYVNTPRMDTRKAMDAPIEDDDTSDLPHDSNIRLYSESLQTTSAKNMSRQNNILTEDSFINAKICLSSFKKYI